MSSLVFVCIVCKQLFTVLYTLKLYSFGFVIQRHCINACDGVLNDDYQLPQFSERLNFIVDYQVIEYPFRASVTPQSPFNQLFTIDIQRTNQYFVNFYGNLGIYGKPDHQNYTAQTHEYITYVESTVRHYLKLWVFGSEIGFSRIRFTEIVNHYRNQFNQIRLQSINLEAVLVVSVDWIRLRHFPYEIETMDLMVLYLMRAMCYCFVANVFAFFHQLNTEVDSETLKGQNRSFAFSRPGWVQFFNTIYHVLNVLEHQRTAHIIYDDELDRINNTFEETSETIKKIYKQCYRRLSYYWRSEIFYAVDNLRANPYTQPQKITFIYFELFQVMFGLAFTARFYNLNRLTFKNSRRRLLTFFTDHCHGAAQVYQLLRSFHAFVNQYLSNGNDIQTASPPHSASCLPFIHQRFPDLLTLQPIQYGLDINQYDNPLI